MKKIYISSDANVWIDYKHLNKLELPFKLPYHNIMNHESLYSELSGIDKLAKRLKQLGLETTNISIEEFELASKYSISYPKLSIQDRIALSISKNRNIILLTGDKNLRSAAEKEKIEVRGSLWILDQLVDHQYISSDEYIECIHSFIRLSNKGRRLPIKELEKRLTKYKVGAD